MDSKKDASIEIQVKLDENKIPEKISWNSSDSPNQQFEECKAFMLAIWDKERKQTLKIDLYTKEMQIDEMDFFVMQTIYTMSDFYQKATNKTETAALFKKFAEEFAKSSGIAKNSGQS